MSSDHILTGKSQGEFNPILTGNRTLKVISGNMEGIVFWFLFFFFLLGYLADELLEDTQNIERPVTTLQELATKFK